MFRTIAALVVLAWLTAFSSTPVIAQSSRTVNYPAPVNPHASPEARALLRYLDSISGKYTITGQHNYPNVGSRWTDRTYDVTGKYPGLYGIDFGFSGEDDKDSVLARPAIIDEIKRQYRNGSLIAITWHEVRPTDDEPVTFRDSVQGHLTNFEWKELLTPGTRLNDRWCAQVDVVAGYLAQLRDAHVPLLFRPDHEMNGTWFWWGWRPGKDGSAALYRQIYDRLVNVHHLDNLVWVWNVNAPSQNAGPFAEYFPGSDYVDVLSVDNYGEFKQTFYDDILALAGNKPIALAETGFIPTLEVLQQQPKWTYFMLWSELAEGMNSLDSLKQVFDAPNSLNRGDPRLAEPMAAIRKLSSDVTPEPVSARATSEAKDLLVRLQSIAGKSTLSGQENEAAKPAAAMEYVAQTTGKSPAIYAADLGITLTDGVDLAPGRQAIIDGAKRQAKNHAVVSLTWRAIRPTDDEPAALDQSVHGKLTDFEWNDLLAPDTNLHKRWAAQVDQVAGYLKQLQDAKIAVMWRPYPEINSKKFWWAGRNGLHGSQSLYRQLFDRMVNHDGLHNLIWVWEAAPEGYGPDANGPWPDYFPGLLYVDALSLNVDNPRNLYRADRQLVLEATGKPIGITIEGKAPDPQMFQQQSWSWFVLAPQKEDATPAAAPTSATQAGSTNAPSATEALQKLYADPHVISAPAANAMSAAGK